MTDQTALDFYSDMESAVRYYGLTHLADREERQLFKKGKTLFNTAVEGVQKTRRTPANGYNLYTENELTQIVNLYLIQDNRQFVSSEFVKSNPTQPHTIDSIEAVVSQLENMDITRPLAEGWVVKSLVREVAHTIAPERFGA